MKSRLTAASLLLLSASGAVAADILPLTKGIYVVVGAPCKGASNVDTLSYWGDDNGINNQRTRCRITGLTRNGSTYWLQRACTDLREGFSFDDKAEITVRNRTSFVIHGGSRFANLDRSFRYCGPKVQF
jgi:hypothetical protein